MISALERYDRFFGDDLKVEYPTGSGTLLPLDEIAADLRAAADRPVRRRAGRAPAVLRRGRAAADATRAWQDNLVFNEYFHGDNGAGLGATHQTGWTGIIADLIRGRPGNGVYAVGDLARARRSERAVR